MMLKPIGLKTVRRAHATRGERDPAWGRLMAALKAYEGLFRQEVAPDLPPNERRFELLERTIGTPIEEVYYLLKSLHEALAVEGDLCEFGVAQGTNSAILANEVLDTERALWLFDSFEGLPKPTDEDELIDDIFELGQMEKYEGRMAHGAERVQGRLAEVDFPETRTHIVKGFIEETSQGDALPERVCFAYLDFDFYQGTKIALDLVHARMPAGGRMVVDDYGFFSSGVETAVAEFLEREGDAYELEPSPDFASAKFATLRKHA